MARYIDADKLIEALKMEFEKEDKKANRAAEYGNYEAAAKYTHGQYCYVTAEDIVNILPTADVVEVDKVAEMFAEQFGDTCPCNFNDNDEWLAEHCEHANTCDCPCKEGWKQFIKHYGERKEK